MGRKPDAAAKSYYSGGGGAGASSPRAARKAPPSPVFLGTALFVLGFVSLFTGHVVTDADWARIRSRWRSKQVNLLETWLLHCLIPRNFVVAWSLMIEVEEESYVLGHLTATPATSLGLGDYLRNWVQEFSIFWQCEVSPEMLLKFYFLCALTKCSLLPYSASSACTPVFYTYFISEYYLNFLGNYRIPLDHLQPWKYAA